MGEGARAGLDDAAKVAAKAYGEDERRRNLGRRAWDGAPGSRHAFYYAVWSALLPLGDDERRRLVAAIASWADGASAPRASHRTLRSDEILNFRTLLGTLGEDLRTSTATSNTSPATTRTSLPCACWI